MGFDSGFKVAHTLSPEERLFLSHIDDSAALASKRGKPRFTRFLTTAQAALCERYCRYIGAKYRFYGGFASSERVMCGFFCEYDEPSDEDFPITRLRFTVRPPSPLTHRDFLGAIMSLGVEREMIGDIVVCEDGAYTALCSEITDPVSMLEKVGRTGLKSVEVVYDDDISSVYRFEEISSTVASLRLDALVSTAVRLSREKASQLVRQGLVSVSGAYDAQPASTLEQGQIFSVRGYGRFILDTVGNETKKGRIHIRILKYL